MSNVIVSSGGTSGPRGNSVLNGTGAPASTTGIDGDFYLDTAANNLYGPKAGGAWPGSFVHLGAAGTLLAANNLSDVANVGTARTNLGLGGAATLNVGTAAGTVAAGDDSRITSALQPGAAAGGDLSGTLPAPTVAKVNGVAVTGAPTAGQVPTATSGTVASWQSLPAASPSAAGTVQLAGDLAGTGAAPQVTGTHLAAPLPVAQGGTGASTAGAALSALNGTPVSAIRAITSSTVTANAWDVLECDATSNPITVTLPANTAGVRVTVKKMDATSNAVTVTGTVDGTTNPTLAYQYGSMELVADGTKWVRVVRPALGALVDYPATTDSRYAQLSGATFTGDVAVGGHLSQNGFYLPMLAPSGRRPAWRASTWAQLFQTGHGWTAGGAGTGSSNVNDTSTFVRGTQSVTVTTAGTGVQSYVRKTGMPSFDVTGKMIRLVFKIDDITNLASMSFYVGSSGLANYLDWGPFHTKSTSGSPDMVQSGEWVTITISWADIKSAAGTYSINAGVPSTTTGFTDMSFAVYDNGAGPVTYHLQSIEIIPDTTTTFPNGVISLVWDDSFQNVYDNGRPLMDTYGFRGTMYNIAGAVGTGGCLTLAEMRSLQNFSGWEMGGHAYSTSSHNLGYNLLTAQQVSDDLRNLRAWMVSNGFTSEHFAYPHGQFGQTTDSVPIDQIAAQYFTTARGIISETIESFGPCMPYRLRSLTGLNDGNGLGGATVSAITAAGGLLDRCAGNGDWLIITLHQIITGTPTDSTQISQAGFSTLLSAINSRGIPVVPVGDMMRYYS